MIASKIYGSAEFAETCAWKLRFRLDRWWDDRPRALVCMANPSRAGADRNDPTIWNLLRLCKPLPVGGFTVVNFEPYIATSPSDLHEWRRLAAADQARSYRSVQIANLRLIGELSEVAAVRIIAWGNLVHRVPHAMRVLRALSTNSTHPLHAFELTKDGRPKHPSARGRHRIEEGRELVLWRPATAISAAKSRTAAQKRGRLPHRPISGLRSFDNRPWRANPD
jgi:hypothetical protein